MSKKNEPKTGLLAFVERHALAFAIFILVAGPAWIWWAYHIDTVAGWLRYLIYDRPDTGLLVMQTVGILMTAGSTLYLLHLQRTGRFWRKD